MLDEKEHFVVQRALVRMLRDFEVVALNSGAELLEVAEHIIDFDLVSDRVAAIILNGSPQIILIAAYAPTALRPEAENTSILR